MKQLWCLLVLYLALGCDTPDASDCLQTTGAIVQSELVVGEFSRILVNPNIELIITEGKEVHIIAESGKNLINEINATVQGDRLVLTNENSCNFFRKYGQTKVYVTTPKLEEIRHASQFTIASNGVLSFPNLRLISEDFVEGTKITSGNFDLDVACENISIVSNNVASFFIRGKVDKLSINFASGIGRFEGAELVAENVNVFHRGTNKMIINPQQSLKGELRSTGDLISKNRPAVVEVQEFYKGRLFFE